MWGHLPHPPESRSPPNSLPATTSTSYLEARAKSRALGPIISARSQPTPWSPWSTICQLCQPSSPGASVSPASIVRAHHKSKETQPTQRTPRRCSKLSVLLLAQLIKGGSCHLVSTGRSLWRAAQRTGLTNTFSSLTKSLPVNSISTAMDFLYCWTWEVRYTCFSNITNCEFASPRKRASAEGVPLGPCQRATRGEEKHFSSNWSIKISFTDRSRRTSDFTLRNVRNARANQEVVWEASG